MTRLNGVLDPPAIVRPAEDLAALAAAINREHIAGEESSRRGLEHFRAAGEALLKAKAQCGHGKWLDWLKSNTKVSQQQASKYMRVAKHWDKLRSGSNLADGMRMLTEDAPDDASEPPPTRSIEDIIRFSRANGAQWFELWASAAVLLEALGRTVEDIAAMLDIDTARVEAILHPVVPSLLASTDGDGFEEAHRHIAVLSRAALCRIHMLQANDHRSASYLAESIGETDAATKLMAVADHHMKAGAKHPCKIRIQGSSFQSVIFNEIAGAMVNHAFNFVRMDESNFWALFRQKAHSWGLVYDLEQSGQLDGWLAAKGSDGGREFALKAGISPKMVAAFYDE